MPNTKRKREPHNPNKSDSSDVDFNDVAERARPSKRTGSQRNRTRKRNRHDSDDLSGTEESSLGENDVVDDSDTGVEMNENGRPKRRTTKMPTKYGESSGSGSEVPDPDEDAELMEEQDPTPTTRGKKSKIVKLVLKKPKHTPTRTTRTGSVSRPGSRRGQSSEPLSAGVRKSSRLHQDDDSPIVALSNSGKHAEIIRPGTRSPEGTRPQRLTRGGKGMKAPAATMIAEEDSGTSQGAGKTVPRQHRGKTVAQQDDDEIAEQGEGQPTDDEPVAALTAEGDEGVGQDGIEQTDNLGGTGAADEVEEDDDSPPSRRRRRTAPASSGRATRPTKKLRKAGDPNSDQDFSPTVEGSEDDLSGTNGSDSSPRKGKRGSGEESGSGQVRKATSRGTLRSRRGSHSGDDVDNEEDPTELQEEINDLQSPRRARRRAAEIVFESTPKTRRAKKAVDYRILRPDILPSEDAEPAQAPTPSRRRGGAGATWQRTLFTTLGPFGGAGGPPPVLGGPGGIGAAGGADSDSSDDERQQPPGGPGAIGMTPTSAAAPSGFLPPLAAHTDQTATAGNPANLGRIKDRKALADADPLGVDQNVNFDSVGGLKDHINQLKEMVSLPLLYPEIFQRFHVTPPRGVLFHGPPGTGKTLLARALAASVSSEGKKITFYMRKGADALSKWVGEAERQLRLLFDEARNTQPSIIFFDEIDGLAPVRSSKQDQIHASIVSTLLALMDGMDGRGQVIVIGATNRPDTIDPALRRPGRFDREFYFPLPGIEARRGIIDIHTSKWQPGLEPSFKDQLAEVTKGYGGADLRALCTEAALNAVQRRYPQIYTSNEKLKIDPSTITITAKDFMISVKKMIPSSQRSTSSGAAPLPKQIEPLLRRSLQQVEALVAEILPQKKKVTALEEAQYEEFDDADGGFQRERLQQDFETSRVFRPRLLVRGAPGMGQQYLAGALLNHFEGLHVQSFDLPTLLSDSTRSLEAAVVQLFAEVRRHKPSVIYLPDVDSWYRTVGGTVISTFLGLLRSLAPTEPVLVLGVLESESELVDVSMLKDLFGYSKRNQYELSRPNQPARHEYFQNVIDYLRKAPSDFPDPLNRKKRQIETLEVAPPPPPPRLPTRAERKLEERKDHQTLNMLKIRIQPVMDQIKLKYRKFRTGVIDENAISYLFNDPDQVGTDIASAVLFRPYEKSADKDGVPGLLEVSSQKFYYNLNIVVMEDRLSNGFYMRPKDFEADIRYLAKDARTLGDRDRTIKANEMLSNVEVDMSVIEMDPLLADCENVYQRETRRARERSEKRALKAAAEMAAEAEAASQQRQIQDLDESLSTELPSMEAPLLGEPVPRQGSLVSFQTPSRPSDGSSLTNGVSSEAATAGTIDRSTVPESNGSSDPSHSTIDVEMTDAGAHEVAVVSQRSIIPTHRSAVVTDDVSQASHPTQRSTAVPSISRERSAISNLSGPTPQRSQHSGITAMPPGSQVEEFINDASTTTSGKKTSDSNPSSDKWNTQSSSGVNGSVPKNQPDWSVLSGKGTGDSQIPDTQGRFTPAVSSPTEASRLIRRHADAVLSSQGSGPHSSQSQPPVPTYSAPSRVILPPSQAASVQALLNPPTAEEPPNTPTHPALILDAVFIAGLHEEFTRRTSGCSLEQLEQINTALMDSIWKQRGEWNRTKVGTEVSRVFNEVIVDLEDMQEVLPASLATTQ